MTDNWKWLESTRQLQVEAYGDTNWPKTGEALAESVKMNALAAMVEIGEAIAEVGWKDWASERGWVNRDAFIRELVDVDHFVANMLVAVGCTDQEWEEAYRKKQQINRDRQTAGYDGRSNKCPRCKRAYDDDTVDCSPAGNGQGWPWCQEIQDLVLNDGTQA